MDLGSIISILQNIAAPLSPDIFLAAIVAGLIFGGIYNHFLGIPKSFVYHKLIAGWGFIVTMFLFRFLTGIITGAAVVANPLAWLGIGILWFIFCFFIFIAQAAAETIHPKDESEIDRILHS